MEHLSRVPKNRIAVLIGKAGRTREMIEKACGGSLTIDSQSGDVSISWEGEPDPIKRMKVPDVISAIGRGFSPERAVQLALLPARAHRRAGAENAGDLCNPF